jgi:hypothetical protein
VGADVAAAGADVVAAGLVLLLDDEHAVAERHTAAALIAARLVVRVFIMVGMVLRCGWPVTVRLLAMLRYGHVQ